MKINPLQQSDMISSYLNKVNSPSAKSNLTTGITDSVQLSEGAQKFSALFKQAKEALEKSGSSEDVKVADIMARMNSNSYNVPTDDVVSNILGGTPSKI